MPSESGGSFAKPRNSSASDSEQLGSLGGNYDSTQWRCGNRQGRSSRSCSKQSRASTSYSEKQSSSSRRSRPGSSPSSSCSRCSYEALAGDWASPQRKAKEIGRGASSWARQFQEERSFERKRGGGSRSRRGRSRAVRLIRWWCPKRFNREGHSRAHFHRQAPDHSCQQEGEVREDAGWRGRKWFSLRFREQFIDRKQEEFSGAASPSEVLERRPSLPLPADRSQSAERFCSTADCAWRTTSRRSYDKRMVSFEVPDSDVSQPHPLDMASGGDLGLLDQQQAGRSTGTLRPLSCSSRSGQHRWRQLGDVECGIAGESTTLPSICPSSSSDTLGTPTLRALRPQVDRSFLGPPQGSRQLCGVEEEAGKFLATRGNSSQGARGGSSTQEAKSQGKKQGRREGQEGDLLSRGGNNNSLAALAGDCSKTGQQSSSNDNSRSPEIQVPGANASSFSGRQALQSALKMMLRSKCRLGGFARSFVTQRWTHRTTGETVNAEVFPMPMPYPEALRSQNGALSRRQAMKCGVVALVICLNYLYLGRPKSCSNVEGISAKLTQRQWESVRRFEHLLQDWVDVSLITPELMGRSAAKVESLEEVLMTLSDAAKTLAKTGDSYFGASREQSQPGKPPVQTASLGHLKTETMTTFKEVDASRLVFVGRPKFSPGPYLDELSRQIFEDPLSVRMPPELCTIRPPKLKVHCSLDEKIKLFSLLDKTDRLRIHLPEEVCPEYGSGLFAVTKSLQKDRLILDSRGANLLESPPRRWIKALASAESLVRITLEDYEDLTCSGNDLKDFYYFFRATSSRARRNVLVGPMHPKAIQELSAVKGHHLKAPVVYGSLNTLAMGDTQAVELAQSCHLGLALQHHILDADMLLTQSKPLPRTQTMLGVVIDDFVTLSKVPNGVDAKSADPSEGARLAEQMQTVYGEVGLMPNVDKAFRDEKASSFWGVDLDGKRGTLRGSLKRAVPLLGLLLQVLEIGACTADLMAILSGSMISLFLFRRRFLSLMDSVFGSYIQRRGDEIFGVTGQLRSDLLILCALLPMAATNLRAAAPTCVAASDASNWGEAGVVAKIPKIVGKELVRHSLRKSVWTRLLAPAAAWLRGHGELEAKDELPEESETFQSNELWALLADGLRYRLLFSKAKSGARHINVGELRAALKTEKILGGRRPSSRLLLGLDSQVALGTLIKGRSASPAMNSELARSIPLMLANDVYSELLYFNTHLNRADQPTRGKEIEEPKSELPGWWKSMVEDEDFQEFDMWLFERGLDPESLSGLPSLAELAGGVSLPGILPGYLRTELMRKTSKEEAEDGPGGQVDPLLPSTSTARPLRGTATCSRGEACPKEAKERKQWRHLGPRLSETARALLADFPESQVVKGDGVIWPPTHAGFLDLYSGERGVAKAIAKRCSSWSLCFDLEDGPNQDLNDKALRKKLETMIRSGCFLALGGGPVCSSFSMAVRPPVRSAEFPYGLPSLSANMEAKVHEGNEMVEWFFSLLGLGLELKLGVWMENPHSSWMFRLPSWKCLAEKWKREMGAWVVDYCRFGKRWRKRTRIVSNTCLIGHRTLCAGGHQHQLLKGRSPSHRMAWTRVAQAYPSGVASAIAEALVRRTGLVVRSGSFDPAACARCGSRRIGEADHPGPRKPRQESRTGLLENVPLVEAKTLALQDKVWAGFLEWMSSTLSPATVKSAMAHAFLLVLFAREYGNYCYATGKSLYVYRHFLVFLQQNHVTIKPYMSLCWTLVSRWELMEPTVHRVPLPEVVFKAMMVVALNWRWFRFCAILSLGFYGIARPGEPLAAFRNELLLPRDLMNEELSVAYLKVLKPKTRHRGRGVVQHLSIYEAKVIGFLTRLFADVDPAERLFACSPGSFRRRWDAILKALQIPKQSGLTPGGIRGGGCVAAFHAGADLPRLLWRMRIKHLQTLESYLQECAASTVVPELPASSRSLVRAAAALYPTVLDKAPDLWVFSMLSALDAMRLSIRGDQAPVLW